MTNNEKYKTASEREIAFTSFCSNSECSGCSIYYEKKRLGIANCVLVWLDRKADECEKRTCKDSLEVGESKIRRTTMVDKLDLVVFLIFLVFTILSIIGMVNALLERRVPFAILAMVCVWFYGTKTLKILKMLIDSSKQDGE